MTSEVLKERSQGKVSIALVWEHNEKGTLPVEVHVTKPGGELVVLKPKSVDEAKSMFDQTHRFLSHPDAKAICGCARCLADFKREGKVYFQEGGESKNEPAGTK